MRAGAERHSSRRTDELVDVYLAGVFARSTCTNTRRSRERPARLFAQVHPDLGAWEAKSVAAKIAELRRIGARHFMEWCFIEGHLRPELEFLLTFKAGSLYSLWAKRNPDQVAKVSEVGERIGWRSTWVKLVAQDGLGMLCMWSGKSLEEISDEDFTAFGDALEEVHSLKAEVYARTRGRAFCVQQACYQLGFCQTPPREWHRGPIPIAEHLESSIPQPAIRRVVERYLAAVATTLVPGTTAMKRQSLILFAEYLAEHHPGVRRLTELDRERHIEPFLVWNRTRTYRGRKRYLGRTVAAETAYRTVGDVRVFFTDLGLWGWAERPNRQLFFHTDTAKKLQPLPRALAPDADRDLMREVRGLSDPFARCALTILRGTGMRVGELLDLELDCLWDTPSHGCWVKVPLGKLKTERMVPLDAETLEAFDAWMKVRGVQRALPHPSEGRPAAFLFMAQGRRLSAYRLRVALREAAAGGGLKGRGEEAPRDPASASPHLRHDADQRRDVPGRADGVARPRDAADDDAIRQARLPDHPRRLRHRDGKGQGAQPDAAARGAVGAKRTAAGSLGMVAIGDAQDPRRTRLLLASPRRRGLPLCQHLRAVRQLRHRARVPARVDRSARRRSGAAPRCASARLGFRSRPARPRHQTNRRPSRTAR
jgi:integrase